MKAAKRTPILMLNTPIPGTNLHRRMQGDREIGPAYLGQGDYFHASDSAIAQASTQGYGCVIIPCGREGVNLVNFFGEWCELSNGRVFDQRVYEFPSKAT